MSTIRKPTRGYPSTADSAEILIDTGPIVAILDRSDAQHTVCVDVLRTVNTPLLVCWPVITEAAWLLRSDPRAVAALLSSFGSGLFELAQLDEPDLSAISAILVMYRSLGIQLADASIVHLANRHGINKVFTLDRRDFGVLRGTSGKPFQLLP